MLLGLVENLILMVLFLFIFLTLKLFGFFLEILELFLVLRLRGNLIQDKST